MTKSYTYLLEQNNVQIWYTDNIFKRRNDKKDDVFGLKLTEFWDNAKSDMTLEDLVYHAVEPLYKTSKLVVDESSKWEDLSLPLRD